MSVRTVLADQSECPYALGQPNGGLMRCTFGWGHAGVHSWEIGPHSESIWHYSGRRFSGIVIHTGACLDQCSLGLKQEDGSIINCTFRSGHTEPHSWEDQQADAVNHPPHYQGNGLEAIHVIEAFGLGFNLGNTVKYILRAGRKGQALEDLKKARWYLEREIGRLEPTAQTSERTSGASDKQNKEEIG